MTQERLGVYRQLLDVSNRARDAAEAANWDSLIELQQQRMQLMAILQAQPDVSSIELSLSEQVELSRLINEIQQSDARTVPLVQHWMSELNELMDSLANEKKLGEIYR